MAAFVPLGCDDDDPAADPVACGYGTDLVDGECVASGCPAGTTLQAGVCQPLPPAPLEPGQFQSPLAFLQRLQGAEDHMHVAQFRYRESDAKLFYCSYGFGVIDASNPQDMEYIVEDLQHQTPSGSPRDPGCLHLAWDDEDPELVFTSHRGNIDFAPFLSGWTLRPSPEDEDEIRPNQIAALQEPGESYGGLDVENGLVYVALQENGLGIYEYVNTVQGVTRIGGGGGFENAWSVAVRGTTAYVADGAGGLATADVSDPDDVKILGRAVIGGNAEDVVLDGNLAFVAAGSAGMGIVDITDPAKPMVLSTVPTPGSAVSVAASAGRAYVAAWNDIRVYDVADPAAPQMIGATRLTINLDYETCAAGDPENCAPDDLRPDATARNLAVAASGDYMFAGNWWVPYSFRVYPDRAAPYMVLPEDVSLMGFPPTMMGKTSTLELPITNEGNAPLTIYDLYTSNPAFTVSQSQVRIDPGETVTLTLGFTASTGAAERGLLNLRSDDPQQPLRQAYLLGNQGGLTVGQPLPDTVATLLDGTTFSSAAEQPGKVMLLAYFATF